MYAFLPKTDGDIKFDFRLLLARFSPEIDIRSIGEKCINVYARTFSASQSEHMLISKPNRYKIYIYLYIYTYETEKELVHSVVFFHCVLWYFSNKLIYQLVIQ